MVEKDASSRPRPVASSNIARENLSLPFRIEKIPVRAELAWANESRVVGDVALRSAEHNENIFSLGIGIPVFASPPLGFVNNLRQHQSGLDRLQDLGGIKFRIVRSHAVNNDIGEKFSRPALGDNPLLDLAPQTRHAEDFDLRISLLKNS
jgi:hypothetical protein